MIKPKLSLTQQERKLFDFIRSEIERCNLSPSYQEMMRHLGLVSKSSVSRLVHALIDKGYIVGAHARNRSIALAPSAHNYTVHLDAELDAKLSAYIRPWGATPEAVITKAVEEYLGRHA